MHPLSNMCQRFPGAKHVRRRAWSNHHVDSLLSHRIVCLPGAHALRRRRHACAQRQRAIRRKIALELYHGTTAVWARKAELGGKAVGVENHRLGISPDPAYFKLKPNAVVLTLGL